jgi:glycosyltransferase involved in cell wall biosynthesis
VKENPYFSIILPTYNRAAFIGKAIDSVLTQTFKDFELIMIDDGSTDNTKEVVSKYSDERIAYYYQENQERSVARNNGISKVKGQYICFLDSDDYYLPNHLGVLYENIVSRNSPIALFHTYQIYCVGGKEEIVEYFDNYKNDRLSETNCRLINNVWLFSPAVQTIAIHKEIAKKISFDLNTIPFECYEFIGRVGAEYNIIKINKRTVVMQIHDNNSTGYNLKLLEGSLNAFQYILSNSIYNNIKSHASVKNRFYTIYTGLADCYSRAGEKMKAMKFLLLSLRFKTDLKNIRLLGGIIKNIIFQT